MTAATDLARQLYVALLALQNTLRELRDFHDRETIERAGWVAMLTVRQTRRLLLALEVDE